MKIKEEYNSLKKRFSLPEYDTLNTIFEISDINPESGIILQKIREKIEDKMLDYIEIIENIVQPETTLKNMYETKYVNDKNKENAYALFKKLMLLKRKSDAASVGNTDEENAEFIKEAFESYISFKAELLKHIIKLRDSWEKDTNVKDDLNYFG